MTGQQAELIAHRDPGGDMMPYERLLRAAIGGDASLFTDAESVEAAWRVVDPILGKSTPIERYAPGSWGPVDADRIIAGDGRWYDPAPAT
jgi:glucose-6-phosphate 1-dehydrogenase